MKDMIITGGENVYGAEVEDVLASHPLMWSRRRSWVRRPRWGETVTAIVVVRARSRGGPGATAASLPGTRCPGAEFRAEPRPRSAAGKLLKRDSALDGRRAATAGPTRPTPASSVGSRRASMLAR